MELQWGAVHGVSRPLRDPEARPDVDRTGQAVRFTEREDRHGGQMGARRVAAEEDSAVREAPLQPPHCRDDLRHDGRDRHWPPPAACGAEHERP